MNLSLDLRAFKSPRQREWSSPNILVPNSSGGYGFCIDYKPLNKVAKVTAQSMPGVHQAIDALQGKNNSLPLIS